MRTVSAFPANPDALPLDDVDMFIVNESEAALLANAAPGTAPATLLEHLHLRFPSADLVVTAGERGTIALLGGTEYAQEAFPVKTVDTTGAGDTFCASSLNYVLEHGLDNLTEENLKELLTFANAAASLITTRKGALRVMSTKEEVLDFMKSRGC